MFFTHLFLIILMTGLVISENCQYRTGYRIQNKQCISDNGCKPGVFNTLSACNRELENQLNRANQDPCSSNPCKNNGLCSQTSQDVRYKCTCFGFYGRNCEKKCPRQDVLESEINGQKRKFKIPSECIVI